MISFQRRARRLNYGLRQRQCYRVFVAYRRRVPSALHRQIAARIREHAKRRKMSLNKLADFAGISRRQLGRILNAEQSTMISTLEKKD